MKDALKRDRDKLILDSHQHMINAFRVVTPDNAENFLKTAGYKVPDRSTCGMGMIETSIVLELLLESDSE